MRRYHLALTHVACIGTQACMEEADDGYYVQHSEHLAEVRQTQRRMIAALYWRAGELACDVADYVACGPEGKEAVSRAATRGGEAIACAMRMGAAL